MIMNESILKSGEVANASLDLGLNEVFEQYNKQSIDLALNKMAALLTAFSDVYRFRKFVYYLHWDGDWESIHSYSSFGNEDDNFYTETYVGDAWRDHFDEFFNEHTLPVNALDKENLEHYMERIAASAGLIEKVIKFKKTKHGFFQAYIFDHKQDEPKQTVEGLLHV